MTPDDIKMRIQSALPDAEISVVDTTGGGDHFSATVVSSAFADKGLVDRHRLVYGALGESMRGSQAPIHALALTTETPEEYRRR
jgi:stress-induced morphogen